MKHIVAGDFPRTAWNEAQGLRTVLVRAFNTSRKSRKRLLALQSWLRFLTTKVNEAILELEDAEDAAVVAAANKVKDDIPELVLPQASTVEVTIPELVIPQLNVLIDVEEQVNG